MQRHVIRSDQAFRDLDQLASYIQQDSPEAAVRFLRAAEACFELIAKMPEGGTLFDYGRFRDSGIRVRTIQGFQNHLVFYCPSETSVEIIRVLHGARDISSAWEE
jgi:toxin ParE1/3/4